MPNRTPCIRCGVCCVNSLCGAWADCEDERGICKALIIDREGHTSCKNIADRRYNPFGGGCAIREFKEGFKIIKEDAEERAGVKLPGLKEKIASRGG